MTKQYRRALGWSAMALVVGALAFVAAGCGGGGSNASETTTEGPSLPTSIGKGEGKLSLVA
jgi:hypothetical protein